MKIILIGEDFPDGLQVDWPAVPGTGDTVSLRWRGGTTTQKVTAVHYETDGDNVLKQVTVTLEY